MKERNDALCQACYEGNFDKVKDEFLAGGSFKEAGHYKVTIRVDGLTIRAHHPSLPLIIAADRGHDDIVKFILGTYTGKEVLLRGRGDWGRDKFMSSSGYNTDPHLVKNPNALDAAILAGHTSVFKKLVIHAILQLTPREQHELLIKQKNSEGSEGSYENILIFIHDKFGQLEDEIIKEVIEDKIQDEVQAILGPLLITNELQKKYHDIYQPYKIEVEKQAKMLAEAKAREAEAKAREAAEKAARLSMLPQANMLLEKIRFEKYYNYFDNFQKKNSHIDIANQFASKLDMIKNNYLKDLDKVKFGEEFIKAIDEMCDTVEKTNYAELKMIREFKSVILAFIQRLSMMFETKAKDNRSLFTQSEPPSDYLRKLNKIRQKIIDQNIAPIPEAKVEQLIKKSHEGLPIATVARSPSIKS